MIYNLDFPSYFDTRLKNNLKRLGFTACDLIFNILEVAPVITKHYSRIGITSLWKITRFRSDFFKEHTELVDDYLLDNKYYIAENR